MTKGQIRFLKVGSQLAVRFDVAAMDDHGCAKLARTTDGKVQRVTETYWLPATVVAIEDGYPLIEGTTAQARGFVKNFHSGVVDQYSVAGIVRL